MWLKKVSFIYFREDNYDDVWNVNLVSVLLNVCVCVGIITIHKTSIHWFCKYTHFCEYPHAGSPCVRADSKSGVKIQFTLSFHILSIGHLQLLFFSTLHLNESAKYA